MINLTQDQFRWASQINDVLAGFQEFFRRKVQAEYLTATANRLAIWGYKGIEVDEAMKTLLNRDDEKFPTANEIRDIVSGSRRAQSGEVSRDPQVAKDREKYKRHYAQFEKALGKELLEKYISVWHEEFFKGSDLGLLQSVVPSKAFDQIAIADLARANGNARRAIQIVRSDKERQTDQSKGSIYEDDRYFFNRGETPGECSFTIKGNANPR